MISASLNFAVKVSAAPLFAASALPVAAGSIREIVRSRSGWRDMVGARWKATVGVEADFDGNPYDPVMLWFFQGSPWSRAIAEFHSDRGGLCLADTVPRFELSWIDGWIARVLQLAPRFTSVAELLTGANAGIGVGALLETERRSQPHFQALHRHTVEVFGHWLVRAIPHGWRSVRPAEYLAGAFTRTSAVLTADYRWLDARITVPDDMRVNSPLDTLLALLDSDHPHRKSAFSRGGPALTQYGGSVLFAEMDSQLVQRLRAWAVPVRSYNLRQKLLRGGVWSRLIRNAVRPLSVCLPFDELRSFEIYV